MVYEYEACNPGKTCARIATSRPQDEIASISWDVSSSHRHYNLAMQRSMASFNGLTASHYLPLATLPVGGSFKYTGLGDHGAMFFLRNQVKTN